MIRKGAQGLTLILAGLFFLAGTNDVLSQSTELVDSLSRDITIEQKLDEQVNLGLTFTNEAGETVPLGTYFGQEKPVVLMLVYYGCPMLCGQVMQGAVKSLKQVPLDIEKDYEIVTVSINPDEDHELASQKKGSFVNLFNRDGADKGWHFLTSDSASVAKLAEQVGFKYYYDEKMGQYAHSAGIMVLTPTGKVSKYFYGIEYNQQDLRLGLVEASEEKIGTLADKILLLCYQYDPTSGTYGFFITNLLKVVGSLTVVVLAGFIFMSLRKDKKAKPVSDKDAGTHTA